ncbi:MAG: endolytic transglycosylase MltG [Bacteroidetes bacterium]|nr:endolytic transglycosylase MltG [Bacteroidota bacterium]MBS1540438.1 endolytic transglycosylase MltG [Bacteroidota bacterium]
MKEFSIRKLVIYVIGSTLLISFSFYAYQICYTPNILVDREDRAFIIRSGDTFADIQKRLYDQQFINDAVSFNFLARISGYDKSVMSGRYLLRRNMTNLQALHVLKSGHQEKVNVTFSYVRLRKELSEKITKNLGLSAGEFNDALDHFISKNQEGFNKDNILCLFIPNTYEIYFNILPEDLVARMDAEYKKFWNEERLAQAKEVGLTPIEVSILASIVQAETIKQDEAPTIAGLYLNRLKKGIALQADPTLVYAVGDFTLKRVLNGHKQIKSPYNTYMYPGLPPGPINVPQIASIDAVLHYQHHDYYYMCAKEDFSGYHNFAHNLEDHNKNARRYQRALDIEMAKAEKNKK